MARGEALLNRTATQSWPELSRALGSLAEARSIEPRFNISTIMPVEAGDLDLVEAFPDPRVALYYYSMSEGFRRRWLPKAQDPRAALDRLARWQSEVGGEIVLHGAVIEGGDDSIEDAECIADAVQPVGIRARFNLVRYNPYGALQGRESGDAQIRAYFDYLAARLGDSRSRIVPRVGFDVKSVMRDVRRACLPSLAFARERIA